MAARQQAIPIIRIKLHGPPVAAELVCHARLHAKLDAEYHLLLTLVAAPAGYDNSATITQGFVPSAWVSLGEGDSDLRVFLSCLVTAIRTLSPNACRDTAEWTDALAMPSIATLSEAFGDDMQ
jgi:ATP/maltotriose-dependent transcriptional regulator MalT